METPGPDAKKKEAEGRRGQKLRLLLDKLHGEDHEFYGKLIQLLTERCQVTILEKKPLNLELLTENDALLLIAPNKSWEEAEVESVRRYVESHGGILVALTIEGRKPERLNQLLEPFGLSLIKDRVSGKDFYKGSLGDSPLLEGVPSLAAGLVWGYASIQIATSNQAEVLLQHKDAILGLKRPLGKGAAYLFSCLPVFGKKQLDQAGNRIFLDNLLKSLATPAMTATLEAIAKDEALAALAIAKDEARAEATASDKALATQKIVGFILTGYSRDLFFTSDTMIVAKKSSMPMFTGWALGGYIGGFIADSAYKGLKGIKLSELSPDKILRDNKRNFAIRYDEIDKIEIRRKAFPFGLVQITINTSTDKHVFDWGLGLARDLKKHTSFLVPLLSDKLSIAD
ncbi:MAG TPA: hypothetical protein G4N91_02920 [Dehalococcoidia bacterium]|nr:hypothetical protein [Dehalococcoidia bacterium]